MSIDWSKAPEGATHATPSGTFIREERGDRFVAYWEWLYEWVLIESGLEKDQLIERPKKPLTQAVYRWAKILENGDAVAGRKYEHKETLLRIGSGYDATDWQNSLIERQEVSNRVEQLRSIEEARQVEKDAVNNPSHYTTGGIECIDAMQAMLSREEFIGYLRGNVFKYQWRYKHKNGIEDLKKAQWYANRLIELEQSK
jgi:hypothetical protein